MAYAWILQNLALLGLDTRHLVSLPDISPPLSPSPLSLATGTTGEHIVLAGDSAGGNLAVTTSMKILEHGTVMYDVDVIILF